MGFSDVKPGLSFQLIDDLGKTFEYSIPLMAQSCQRHLQTGFIGRWHRKQDEIVTIQNTKNLHRALIIKCTKRVEDSQVCIKA